MPFSASACLTGLGTTTLGPTLSIYTNPVSNINPGTLLGTVATSLITGNACPYTFIVPDGTTTVRLFDPVTFCYADIPVSDNNVCSTCNLTFTSIGNNLLSTINVGSLAGTCTPAITDYRISWYGPNSPTTLAFTSGAGTIWPQRDATQPITPTSTDAPFLEPGTYISKITEVKLNNVRFSYIGGNNNVLSPSLLNCSYTVSVSPYTCLNGVNPKIDGYYSHQKTYITDGSSPPKSGNAVISLGAGTQSLIWAFSGVSIYDTLKLTFNGSSYSNPIVLEDFRLGGDVSSDTRPTTFPKRYGSTSEFRKITMLTGLVVNNNDTILIDVTPNSNPAYATSWNLKFGCNPTLTSSKTCLDDYKNKPYKIQKSSIIPGTPNICGQLSISFNISGCSISDNSPFINSDLVKLTSSLSNEINNFNDVSKLRNFSASFGPQLISINQDNSSRPSTCTSSGANTGTITISKSNVNEFTIFCSNQSDILSFESSFNVSRNASINNPNIPAYTPNDSTNVNYYRFFLIEFYTNLSNYSCGDGAVSTNYWLHCSSTYTLNTTVGGYLMTIQTPLISTNYPCTQCIAGCSNMYNFITGPNGANVLRNSTFNYSNTSGLRRTNPFWFSVAHKGSITPAVTQAEFTGSLGLDPKYSTNTYASTSDGQNTLIPSLSATSWDWQNHFAEINAAGVNPSYKQDVFKYKIVVETFTPLRYKIYAQPISNFLASGTYDPIAIYDSLTPSAFNSTYIY
jgi:hypothetical protein